MMGRQIIYKYYDDGYNPANTAQLTRRLVEQDKVFATVGQLGTEPVLAARAYLNQQKVPQALVSTGASYWGTPVQGIPVDDRLAARLHRRGSALRPPHQGELQREEDRDRLPERRLRQGLSLRSPGGARQAVRRRQRRRAGGGRGHGDVRRVATWRGSGRAVRQIFAVFQLPSPTIAHDRDRQGARVSTPSRST